jgi:hypothetical protein
LSVLEIDPALEISVIFPHQWTASDRVTRLGAGEMLRIPHPGKDGFQLLTQEPNPAVRGVHTALMAALSVTFEGPLGRAGAAPLYHIQRINAIRSEGVLQCQRPGVAALLSGRLRACLQINY